MHGRKGLMHMKLKRTLSAAAAIAALVFPTAAFAQQSAQDAYKPQGQVEQDVAGDQGGSAGGGAVAGSAESSASGLPFTGMDVALLAGAGTLLLCAGVGMRRFAHRQDPV
jgi:hypothetical protein